ncbi:MAG TPA: POTRA domain-containing protein [Cyclobacteriaceae bacterium]|jgi:outer membrane protein insertion porin family
MKRLLLLLLLALAVVDSQAQFRRRDRAPASPSDNRLNYANPSEYVIGGISVEGLNILDENAIISLTGLRVGDKIKIPGDAISGAIRKLWKHGLVGDVTISVDRIEGENVFLKILLAERPRLTSYYFVGISKGKESALKEDIDLIRGRIVTDAMIRNTQTAVRKHFVKKGYLNAEVKVIQEADTLTREGVRLRIVVNPKSKVKINSIDIYGNENIPDSKIKKKMKGTHERAGIYLHRAIISELLARKPADYLAEKKKASWMEAREFLNKNVRLNIFNTSKYIQSDYEEDKKKVIAFYNSRGYRDAEIVMDTVYNHDDRTINLEMQIYEGPKYYFRNIYWTGNYIHTDRTLNAILGIKKGDVYDRELLQRKITFNPKGADISGLYMDDGYLFFRIQPYEVAIAGDSIDVEMRITEGEQATINQVTITGNERTSDHVIRRELRTVPGRKFSRSDIIRTQQSLAQLGYFNPEKISQNLVPNPANGTVDIEWSVEEQSNDQIELSGGWGGYYGFVGTLGLTFNNFSIRNIPDRSKWRPLPVGDGQRLSLRMQANGKAYQNYGFSFTEPWLGGRKPQSFSVSFNHSVQRAFYYGFRAEVNDAQRLSVLNFSVGLGRLLEWPDNYFTLSNSISYTKYSLRDYPVGIGFSNGDANSITFNTTLSRRSTGDPRYPTEGSEISLSVSFTPPFSLWRNINYNSYDPEDPEAVETFNQQKFKWIEYHKWMFDAKYYMPLDNKKKLVLEAKAHFGFIGSYSKKYGIGPFERFFMGGAGLAGGIGSFVLGQEIIGLRGYEDNLVTPPLYARYGQESPKTTQGGIVYDKLGLELRYPVTTGNAATIYGFIFTEAGGNWGNYEDFNPFKLYKSAGAGVRLFMPAFGLIGLNWAYGFDRLPFSNEISGSQFHFTIGQQLR